MLWKKVSNRTDAMYVDIFAMNGGQAELASVLRHVRCEKTDTNTNKDDAISLQKRNEGNVYFNNGNWIWAAEKYGESLCYAVNGSKNISLAYANRATCFLKMKQYNECLVDIELAKQAGYPTELMPKLERRKDECLKAMENGEQLIMIESKLSFEPDKQFPSMANVLEFGVDSEGDAVLFAKEDIDVGETIVVEKPFMTYVYSHYGGECNICLKDRANLIPCKKCTKAMFCSEECQSSHLHEYECGLKVCKCDSSNTTILRILRSFLLAANLFSSADELMNFVEKAKSIDRSEIPTTFSNAKSQYAAFLMLPILYPAIPEELLCMVYEVYRTILTIPKFKAMFKSEKHRRFLMHLLSFHCQILELNSTVRKAMFERQSANENAHHGHDEVKWFDSSTGLIKRFFKHSCSPNVYDTSYNGNAVVITVRPVKKGQQLTHTLLLQLLTQTKTERKQVLWQERKMVCKCLRCKGLKASPAQQRLIAEDPEYKQLCSESDDDEDDRSESYFEEKMQSSLAACKSLLRKYGQFNWCDELGDIVEVYIHLLLIKRSDGLTGSPNKQ